MQRRFAKLSICAVAIVALAGAASVLAKITPDAVEIDVPIYDIGDQRVEPLDEIWNFKFGWSGIPVGAIAITGRTRGAIIPATSTEDITNDGPGEPTAAAPDMAVEVSGRTNAFIDLLWRYRLEAKGQINLEPFGPSNFTIVENEKRREKITTISFPGDGSVHSTKRKGSDFEEFRFEAPNTYDIISAIFLMMHIDYELGETYNIDAITGTSRYLVTVAVEARETIEVMNRAVDAYRLLITTRDLTDPEDDQKHGGTNMWVSVEPPRRVLKAWAKTKWGAISGELVSIYDSRAAAAPVALFPFDEPSSSAAVVSTEPQQQRRSPRSSFRGRPRLR